MTVNEVIAARWAGSSHTLEWLAQLLRVEGTDLMTASEIELARGTPVYVEGNADVVEVQRRMSEHHIRSIPVLDDGTLIGVVDLLELALMESLVEADSIQR